MFSKDRQPLSGQSQMMAAALKMIGIPPEVLEGISRGLLEDLKSIVVQQKETLDRLEWVLRSSAALDETRFPSAWDEYLTKKAEAQNHDSHHNGGGNPAIGGPAG